MYTMRIKGTGGRSAIRISPVVNFDTPGIIYYYLYMDTIIL